MKPVELRRGVVAASAGNHAQSVAWPSALLGIPAVLVPPADTAQIKVEAVRRPGGAVAPSELRSMRPCADPDLIFVPLGGGGLAGGVEATKVARIFNDLALEVCAPAPDRLLPFAQVPLQDPDPACEEVDRCVANGHLGVEIGNHVGDRDLDDEGVVTFLQHCADRGVPVFVHPWDMPTSPRLDRWMARWITGMPAETHLSIVAMVLGGVFDRAPESLRICFAHGGGSFAFWLGRLENAWYGRGDIIATSEMPPSKYVSRFSVDSVVFDPTALRTLVDTLGVDNVMVGSDYPYPLGERPVGNVVHQADFLDDAARAALLGGNAQRFLGLEAAKVSMRQIDHGSDVT